MRNWKPKVLRIRPKLVPKLKPKYVRRKASGLPNKNRKSKKPPRKPIPKFKAASRKFKNTNRTLIKRLPNMLTRAMQTPSVNVAMRSKKRLRKNKKAKKKVPDSSDGWPAKPKHSSTKSNQPSKRRLMQRVKPSKLP